MTFDRAEWIREVENGKIPQNKLAKIEPTQFDFDLAGPALLHPEAASAMSALLAAAKADGQQFVVKYSYRTLAKQWEKWRDYQNGGNLAAYPGTSNHGLALSVDLTDLGETDISWLRNNARRYGFVNDVPSEIWHWTYQGGWEGGKEDDVSFDLYTDGWDKYEERYKSLGKDPGPAPSDRENAFKKGWSHARSAFNNPKK